MTTFTMIIGKTKFQRGQYCLTTVNDKSLCDGLSQLEAWKKDQEKAKHMTTIACVLENTTKSMSRAGIEERMGKTVTIKLNLPADNADIVPTIKEQLHAQLF